MSNLTKKNLFAKNAILYKDMTIDMKRPKIMIIMLIINALTAMIASGFLIGIEATGMNGEAISYRLLATLLIVLIAVEAGVLFVMTPALTGSSIAGERERQTLDVLLTTRMTPMEIILGKFLSVVTMGSLLVFSTFPIMALVFIYGGINFFQLLGLVAVLIFEIGYVSCFGIFFSSATKRTAPSVILSYVTLGFLIGGTLAVFGMVYGLVEAAFFNYRNYTMSAGAAGQEVHADWMIYILLLNPGVTIFDCIGSFLGAEIDDVTFKGMRTIVDLNYINGDSFGIVFWTPISLVIQSTVVYGMLRWSAHCLNPVKNAKKREKQYDMKNMKNIGVQPDFDQMPVSAQTPKPEMTQTVTQNPDGTQGLQ